MKTWLLVIGVLASMSISPTLAGADEADDYFAQGSKLAEQGNAPDAEAAFEKAWALRKAWDIAGNLGLMEAEQGKWTEAAEHLHYAVTHIGSLATDEQKMGLKQRYDNVKARLGLVTVRTNVVATVKVGARTLSSDDPLFLTEGKHQLECSAPGYESVTVDVTSVKGETQELSFELKQTREQPDPRPIVPTKEKPLWPALVLGVSGGAFLVGGLGTLIGGVVMKGGVQDDTSSGGCATTTGCTELEGEYDDAKLLGTVGVVGMSVGAAALAGMGIYLLVVSDGAPDGANIGLRVSPHAVVLEGSF